MVTAMMGVPGETGLLELLCRGERSARSSLLERRCEVIQLAGFRAVAHVAGILSSLLDAVRDLRDGLAKLTRIVLLQLG
jgi:hypothetical protein